MRGTAVYHSPVGDIRLDWEDGAVTALKNADADTKSDAPNELTRRVFAQLDEYFAGTRMTFDFAWRAHGTPFQQKVWAALCEIPYGETRTYGNLAKDVANRFGRERMSAQAVGGAVGRNPIGLIVPCHRVVGANGALTGYAAGLDKKRRLLELEQGKSTSVLFSK